MLYFAYGSNLHPKRLQERVVSASLVGTAKLTGHRLVFHKRGLDNSAKCDIAETGDANDVVYGAVFSFPERDRNLLDRFEGVGNGYEATMVEISSSSGQERVFTYRAQIGHVDSSLKPFHWYKDMVLAGAMFHGFPDDYISQISSTVSETDPDPKRNEENAVLLERIRTLNAPPTPNPNGSLNFGRYKK